MTAADKRGLSALQRLTRGRFVRLLVVCAALTGFAPAFIRAQPAQMPLTEHEVKALCILNFAKYTAWPASAFADAHAAIHIGVIGQDSISEDIKRVAAGKMIAGRPVVVRSLAFGDDAADCQILFISASENKNTAEILKGLRNKPVLTIGETDSFLEQGGAINFMLRKSRVRFDVNLNAVRSAGLQISSKVLALADEVRGNR